MNEQWYPCKETYNPSLNIQGNFSHYIGSLAPAHDISCQFLQIYYLDPYGAIERKLHITERPEYRVIVRMTEVVLQQ